MTNHTLNDKTTLKDNYKLSNNCKLVFFLFSNANHLNLFLHDVKRNFMINLNRFAKINVEIYFAFKDQLETTNTVMK